MSSSRGKRHAFSSLELCFVAIVLAGSLTVLANGRAWCTGRARQVSCASNLNELYTAMQIYSADYSDRLPATRDHLDVLPKLIKNTQVFHCPAAPSEGGAPGAPAVSNYAFRLGGGLDGRSQELLAWDDTSDRHVFERWNACFLDGTVRSLRAEEFEWRARPLPWGKPRLQTTPEP